MSMLFFDPNPDQIYVIDKSIDENSIEEVDMINPPSLFHGRKLFALKIFLAPNN